MEKDSRDLGSPTSSPSIPPVENSWEGSCNRGLLDGELVDITKIPNAVDGTRYTNYNLAPGEYLLQCPYEKSHCILPTKMGNHLVRCRRNYSKQLTQNGLPEQTLIPCKWNPVAHLVQEKELIYHQNQCCDRNKTNEDLVSHLKYAPKKKFPSTDQVSYDENWDYDPKSYGTYDPKIKMERDLVIYQPKMMTKVEKEAWREKERRRWYYEASGTGVFGSFRNERLDKLHGQGLQTIYEEEETSSEEATEMYFRGPLKF